MATTEPTGRTDAAAVRAPLATATVRARRITNRSLSHWIITLLAWCVLLFLLLPLFVVVAISFTETDYLAFPPVGFTLKWYHDFMANPLYVNSFVLSMKLAAASTGCAFLLGIPAAIVLSRAQFPGVSALRSFFLSPLILPGIIIGVGVLQITSLLGFGRTFQAMLVGHLVLILPYVIRTSLASLEGFDSTLEEVAQDLGASKLATFVLVTFPMIKPGVIAGCLFGLIMSWIDVEVSIFNTVIVESPISVNIFNYVQYGVDPTIAAVSAGTIYVAFVFVLLLDRLVGFEKVTMSR